MDFALKQGKTATANSIRLGFNPCFDGFCSKTPLAEKAGEIEEK